MSDPSQITCPACGHHFALSDALTRELHARHAAELARARSEAAATAAAELQAKLAAAEKAAAEKAAAAEKTATAELARELEAARAEAAAREAQLTEARAAELELRKKTLELEDREKSLELTLARQIDAEREKLRTEAAAKAAEEHRLKEAEKEKQIADLRRTIDELKRKSEQGSQQLQGEVLELDFEAKLRAEFALDDIAPVEKGVRGADILQTVRSRTGQACGKIIWELKRTKAWKDEWLAKLKDDQISAGAEIAVIVTEVLPKNLEKGGWQNGVWVTDFGSALLAARVLRHELGMLQQQKVAASGKDEKMTAIYNYITSATFRHKIEAIVETFTSMQSQIAAEKRAFAKHWSLREQQLERIIENTAGLHGDLAGIAGASLPPVAALELPDAEAETADESPRLL